MFKKEIEKYYLKLHQLQQSGATGNESVIRAAFAGLLETYCDSKKLVLLQELPYKNLNIRPDGTVRGNLPNIDFGHWESKDIYDNIDSEIEKKIAKNYPTENIIFENSKTIVLIRHGQELLRCNILNDKELDNLLKTFINYEPKLITDFNIAIELFKKDVPFIADELRTMIDVQSIENENFKHCQAEFLKLCMQSIDQTIKPEDIREMLIQHILTDEIFSTVYNETHFHRENNIAKELQKVVDTFFSYQTRRNTLAKIDHYYKTIKTYAAQIDDYHHKQDFLKIVYENFYKAYNPKGADKLGIVFTPNEIVKFMIDSADYLTDYHFGKTLSDKNVDILDPATGTGTFITDLIRHISPEKLEYKYKNEIHANEVSILPYYIANLNIEYTYQQKMHKYEPFNNMVFVDTLENFHALNWDRKGKDQGFMQDLYAVTVENTERIKKQNDKKISVIIGNPPYNANQQNWNDINKNKSYPKIDERIKQTYIKRSNAQKTKMYDMFTRFFRWSSDRLHCDGIIAFITNSALINKKTYDGFRASIYDEFQYAYIVDLGGDMREQSADNEAKASNVFPIKVGVAITFLVKDSSKKDKKCSIKYIKINENSRKEKLDYLAFSKFHLLDFQSLVPDKNNNWLHTQENNFEELIPMYDKNGNGIFKDLFNGVNTARDEWVTDFNSSNLENKIKYFIKIYNDDVTNLHKIKNNSELESKLNLNIKWSEGLENKLKQNKKIKYNKKKISKIAYRPFINKLFYGDIICNERLTSNHYRFYGKNLQTPNPTILFATTQRQEFSACASQYLSFFQYFMDPAKCASLYYFDENNEQIINVNNWAINKFREYYQNQNISAEDIFYYTYSVLHNPNYREKYSQNLKREFPRLPFYNDFFKWAAWGKQLIDLHINYDSIEVSNLPDLKNLADLKNPKVKLKAKRESGEIIIDENTTITNIPELAWEYKLGNRSALEWILDQYQEINYSEKTIENYPDKKTLSEQFNFYKFADYKNFVIDLISKVISVSVKTVEIMNEMKNET